jgi:hypothetical protein
MDRIAQATPTRTTDSTQADEALRRSRAADAGIREMLARRAGLQFLRGLTDLTRKLPHPDGPTIRVFAVLIDSGEDLGSVDVDATNASDLGFLASRRDHTVRTAAPVPAPASKPALRLVGGGR